MVGAETPDHHASHRQLIWPVEELTAPVKLDAIIVPTVRPVECLEEAALAALSLGCPLVTMHSRGSNAAKAFAQLSPDVDLIAIDVHESAHLRLPALETSRLLVGTIFERQTDVSTKRNLGLVLSSMLGWERVVFLDDDICVPNPADLIRAVSLLDTHTAVGLRIGGFPDNSMVCHAFRDAGGWQDTFIGGGALAVDVRRNRTFFPNIYNEDWFFIVDAGKGLQSVATVGEVRQDPYDPYKVERARSEELGDVLAEGTFWLLDQERSISDGDLDHWRGFLKKRRRFIEQVSTMVEQTTNIDLMERVRRTEALKAALAHLACITPELCVKYMKALVTDQERWQRHIQVIRRQPKPTRELALKALVRRRGIPLTWQIRKESSADRTSTAKGRRIMLGLRRVSLSELQASIPWPPGIPAIPRVVSAAWRPWRRPARIEVADSHVAHALVAGDVALVGQEGQSDDDDCGDNRPSQQLHA